MSNSNCVSARLIKRFIDKEDLTPEDAVTFFYRSVYRVGVWGLKPDLFLVLSFN